MTFCVFVVENIKVLDILVSATKRLARAIRQGFSVLFSFIPRQTVLMQASGNKAPPVKNNKKGGKN